jgi:starch phosphorylase
LVKNWFNIKIADIDISEPTEIQVNQKIAVKARIDLATLTPNDVQIELYQGNVDADGEIVNGVPVVMDFQGADQQGYSSYTANITYTASGLQGLSLRVLPKHKDLSSPYEPKLILWASDPSAVRIHTLDSQLRGNDDVTSSAIAQHPVTL